LRALTAFSALAQIVSLGSSFGGSSMLPTRHHTSAPAQRSHRGTLAFITGALASVLALAATGATASEATFSGVNTAAVVHAASASASRQVAHSSGAAHSRQHTQATGAKVTDLSNALPDPGTVLPRFSPVYMGTHWSMTEAQAVTIAQEFDVIAAQASVFPKYVTAMKAANPNLRIVAYINGTFDLGGGSSYPAAWYETSSAGARIQSQFGNYLLDPGNTSWEQNVAQQCTSAIAKSHYDGCFVDTLGTAPLDPGYVTGLPMDPSTHAVWSGTQWLDATTAIAAAVQAANPGALVIANGLANGTKYFASTGATSQLLGPSGAAMAELWLRAPGAGVTQYPTVAKWLSNVNMLVNAEANDQSILTTTKLWVTATAAQQAQWHKFALSSFLLGADGHSYFSFLEDRTNTAIVQDYAWDHVNIGTPLGAFSQNGNLYERSFTNGIVAVNPTDTPATITFAGNYTNLDGTVLTSETLAPDSGDVFLQQG
jgi:hypothetical protein